MKPNILILYYGVMPYCIPVWKILTEKGYNVEVLQRDIGKAFPFKLENEIPGLHIKNLSEFGNDYNSFSKYCDDVNPVMIMACEGKYKWYLKYLYKYRSKSPQTPVLMACDAQWLGGGGNWLKRLTFPFMYNKIYTHVLAAGLWQTVYALKVGFKREQIIRPFYSANTPLYENVDIECKKNNYPKNFLYVGRLVDVKGIRNIIEAWSSIADRKGWTLTFIGKGDLFDYIQKNADKDVILHDYMSQPDICKIMEKSGCALIPSHYEPWGLVVHEAAAAGLPMIVCENVGSANMFVQDKYNGITVRENDTNDLKRAMEMIINSSDEQLLEMSHRSRRLSRRICPEDVASAMLSVM